MAKEAILTVKIEGLDKQINQLSLLTNEIEDLNKTQKELAKTSGKSSEAYQRNAIEIKQLKDRKKELGREIDNNIKKQNAQKGSIEQLRRELSQVTIKWKNLSEDQRKNSDVGKELTKRKKELTEQIKKEERATGDARRNVGNYKESATKLMTTMAGLYATIKGAKVIWDTAKKSIMSTQETGDRFTQMTTGMKSALQEFYRTLATGDFSNFLSNMKEAYKAGVEYAKQLDLIWDLTNANSITVSKLRTEEANQMNILRDRTKSLEERQMAMNKLLDIKKQILTENEDVAQRAYDNEINNIKARTKLSQEEIEYLIGNKKAQEDINEGMELNNKLIEENTKLTNIGTATDPYYKKILDVKAYNQSLSMLSKEQQNNIKYSLAWNKVVDQEGENAEATRKSLTDKAVALENVKTQYARSEQEIIRYKAQLQSLIDKEEDSNDKIDKKTGKVDEYTKWAIEQDKIKREMDNAEIEADAKRKERQSKKAEQDKIDLENSTEYLDQKAEKDIAREEMVAAKTIEANKEISDYKKSRRDEERLSQINANNALLDSTSNLFGELGKKNRAFALAQIAADTARAISGAIAQATAPNVIFPANIAAIITGITAVLGGAAQAKAVLKEGFADGGFTGTGGKYEPAGIVHKGEWVGRSEFVKSNPDLFNTLESMQRGYASGGFVAMASNNVSSATIQNDALENIVNKVVDRVAAIPVVQDINGLNSAMNMNRKVNNLGDL